jgi:hypothetical protein
MNFNNLQCKIGANVYNCESKQSEQSTVQWTTFFWDDAPCSLVETDRRFGGAYCLHRQACDGGSKDL